MIIIKNISWSNWFSYGENNYLDLDSCKVTQIIGRNGSGKSSIPVILGEVLYGKNALGKTKQKIFNRYVDKPTLTAAIEFSKDEDEYKIDFTRKTTVKVSLYRNGEDISSHSSTNTIKTIQDILGYDFKTFWGLVYQSSKDGLEFLTATDTNRKKFLINLFNLMQYTTIHEFFKKLLSEKNTELKVIEGKLSTIQSWIEKHLKEDLIEKSIVEVPILDQKYIDELTNLKSDLANLKDSNKKINDNEQYKKLLAALDTNILYENIEVPDKTDLLTGKSELLTRQIELKHQVNTAYERIKKLDSLGDRCDRCLQEIDQETRTKMIVEDEAAIDILEEENKEIIEALKVIEEKLEEINIVEKRLGEKNKVSGELQNLLSKIDNELSNEIVLESELQDKISVLNKKIENIQTNIKTATAINMQAEAHNSKVKVIKEQLEEYKEQLDELKTQIAERQIINENLEIIKKAFSTNGLVSYKIESLSKDLEDRINTYLAELSKGRFQLQFTISGDKLNIEIIDDGASISIEELSAGELARVNTATLLAIRKLMAAISSNKINILFLDEITGVLDDEGKEVLIDILNNEDELNTFLVSHEYTHPLVPQITIVKENKISKIEE